MKTILLPTDFSANSRNAIFYANQLYKKEACNFLLLHAYKVDDYDEGSRLIPVPGKTAMEEAKHQVNTKLQELVEEIRLESTGADHRWKHMAVNKPLQQAVNNAVTALKIHLVIIGTKGHTGSSEVIYGSNTVNLMEEVQNCPVLAVPAHIVFKPLKEIVLAHSFKTGIMAGDLEFLVEYSKKHQAPLRILHIQEEGGLTQNQKRHKKGLRENLEKQEITFSFHALEFLSVPLGIYSFTESRGSDMIALINRKHNLLETLLLDPVYKNLANYSKIPVLVLHQY